MRKDAGSARPQRRRWLRGNASAGHRIAALVCVVGLGLGVMLAVIYNWPASPDFIMYFTLRPAWCWFAFTATLVAIGALGLKTRPWIACAVMWFAALCVSEEVLPLVRLSPGAAEARFESLRSARSTDAAFALRIITWNVAADPATTGQAFAQIAAYDPDVVFLQECSTGSIVPDALARSEHFKTYTLLRSFDNAILSRWPVDAVDAAIPKREGHMAKLDPPGRAPIYLLNLHLMVCPLMDKIVPDQNVMSFSSTRLDDLFGLMRGPLPSPLIVAGDFNTPGGYADLRNAMRGYTDAFLRAGRGWGKTIPAALAMCRIDLVYLPAGFTAVDCYALPTEWSDHKPVVADVLAPSGA